MTMDIHLQITLPDDCVTPNVPRIKASFFNRKYRDLQTTPTTPKVGHARIKVTSSGRGRPKRSATGSAGSGRSKTTTPSASRPIKGRSSINESFDLDFSTPRATRHLLTPPSTNFTKSNKSGRVTHLIYRPLELDNESSSESMDTRRKRKRLEELSSSESRSPLAIEAPRPALDDSSTQIIDYRQDLTYLDPMLEKSNPSIETESGSAQDGPKSRVKEERQDDFKSIVEAGTRGQEELKQLQDCDKPANKNKVVESDEPEIIEVEPDLPELPSFVPGNCNMENILKLFGKPSQEI